MLYGDGMSRFSTLRAPVEARQEIKKSRFLAHAGPVGSEAEAKAFIASHADATAGHNCWAWRIGQNYRFSDDGEPGGTAGKPILQAIDGQALDRVAVLVSRWFGGTLLGSGGLIRAYGGTAALGLRSAQTLPLIETVAARLECGFGELTLLQSRLGAVAGVELAAPLFHAQGVTLAITLPKTTADTLARMVTDLTSGRSTLKFDEP